jgi:hypothetical protein
MVQLACKITWQAYGWLSRRTSVTALQRFHFALSSLVVLHLTYLELAHSDHRLTARHDAVEGSFQPWSGLCAGQSDRSTLDLGDKTQRPIRRQRTSHRAILSRRRERKRSLRYDSRSLHRNLQERARRRKSYRGPKKRTRRGMRA